MSTPRTPRNTRRARLSADKCKSDTVIHRAKADNEAEVQSHLDQIRRDRKKMNY